MLVPEHHTIKTCMGNGDKALNILNLSTRWRWVVRFSLWQLYHWGIRPLNTLDSRMDKTSLGRLTRTFLWKSQNSTHIIQYKLLGEFVHFYWLITIILRFKSIYSVKSSSCLSTNIFAKSSIWTTEIVVLISWYQETGVWLFEHDMEHLLFQPYKCKF
jgi:hypothetical protein